MRSSSESFSTKLQKSQGKRGKKEKDNDERRGNDEKTGNGRKDRL